MMARCHIRHVDLEGEIRPLAAEPGYQGVLVIFWWAELPLGQRLFLASELPIPASVLGGLAARAVAPAVAERSGKDRRQIAALPALRDSLAQFAMTTAARSTEPVSVIVCTRNRPADLARCLGSLMPTLAADAEVVVVDNAPGTSGTRQIVERFPRVRIIDEPRPGLSIARNTGIAATAGEIIAFTDDDVVVHPRWLERLRAAFADPATMCVTGLVLPAELETEAQTVFELGLGGFGQGYQPRSFDSAWLRSGRRGCPPVWKLGAGANMALRRSALARVGGFDERLGAGAAGCSEDSELWYRLLAAGQLCRYVPDVVVFHHHRREWSSLRAQMYAYMRGHVAALLVQFGYGRDPRHLTRIGVQLPMFYIRELLRGWQGRSPHDRHRLLADQVRGSIAGLAALRRSAPPASRRAA